MNTQQRLELLEASQRKIMAELIPLRYVVKMVALISPTHQTFLKPVLTKLYDELNAEMAAQSFDAAFQLAARANWDSIAGDVLKMASVVDLLQDRAP